MANAKERTLVGYVVRREVDGRREYQGPWTAKDPANWGPVANASRYPVPSKGSAEADALDYGGKVVAVYRVKRKAAKAVDTREVLWVVRRTSKAGTQQFCGAAGWVDDVDDALWRPLPDADYLAQAHAGVLGDQWIVDRVGVSP